MSASGSILGDNEFFERILYHTLANTQSGDILLGDKSYHYIFCHFKSNDKNASFDQMKEGGDIYTLTVNGVTSWVSNIHWDLFSTMVHDIEYRARTPEFTEPVPKSKKRRLV